MLLSIEEEPVPWRLPGGLCTGMTPMQVAHVAQHLQTSTGGFRAIGSRGFSPVLLSVDKRRLVAPSAAADRLGGLVSQHGGELQSQPTDGPVFMHHCLALMDDDPDQSYAAQYMHDVGLQSIGLPPVEPSSSCCGIHCYCMIVL